LRCGQFFNNSISWNPASETDFLSNVKQVKNASENFSFTTDGFRHLAFSDRVSGLRGFEAIENGYAANEEEAEYKEAVFFEVNDDKRANKPAGAKDKMEKLNPVVLIVSGKEFENTHVTDNINHATTSGTDKHTEGQI
jgi:hypothetical protein